MAKQDMDSNRSGLSARQTLGELIPLFCILLAVSGCFKKSTKFTIDNPTAQPISISIDDKAHEVSPQADAQVTLDAGEHTLNSKVTGKLKFIVYADNPGALINPTLTPYVISNEVYATNHTTAKSFRPTESTVTIDGVAFTGPFELHDDLFIEKTWDFGVREDFAETLRVGAGSNGNIQSKIFNKDDFVAYVESHQNERGRFEKLRKPVAPVWHAPKPKTLPHFADAAFEAETKPLRDLYEQYAQAATADQQLTLRKSLTPLLTKLVYAFSAKASTAGREENEKYNTFVNGISDIFSHSARVEN